MKMGHSFLECKVCHRSSLEKRIPSGSHTAPSGLQGSSTSARKFRAAPEGVCIITCIHGLQEMRGTPFGFSFQRNMEFPSTTAVQVFCLCGDEVFLLALGKSLSCKLKEPHSPWPMQPLPLPGVLSSTGHCSGNSAQPGQTPQNSAKWERGASKAHPTMGPSGQGPWS